MTNSSLSLSTRNDKHEAVNWRELPLPILAWPERWRCPSCLRWVSETGRVGLYFPKARPDRIVLYHLCRRCGRQYARGGKAQAKVMTAVEAYVDLDGPALPLEVFQRIVEEEARR